MNYTCLSAPPPPSPEAEVELQSQCKEICLIGSGHCLSLRRWVSGLHAAVKQMKVEVEWACGTEAKKWTRRGWVAVTEGRFT